MSVVALGTLVVTALQHASRTVPIVFPSVTDPVGAGIVDEPGAAGSQHTGFYLPEYGTEREIARAFEGGRAPPGARGGLRR